MRYIGPFIIIFIIIVIIVIDVIVIIIIKTHFLKRVPAAALWPTTIVTVDNWPALFA